MAENLIPSLMNIPLGKGALLCIRPAEHMRLDNIKLCGKTFSIDINSGNFTVTCANEVYESSIGEPITLA